MKLLINFYTEFIKTIFFLEQKWQKKKKMVKNLSFLETCMNIEL